MVVVLSACASHRSAVISVAAPPTSRLFAAYRFAHGQWLPYDDHVGRSERVLVLAHGVLETLATAFPPATVARIRSRGGYDDVLGVSYDWSARTTDIAPPFAAFLARIPARWIDVEAHSYGTIQTLAAIERAHVTPRNAVLLGAPLDGTPLANPTVMTQSLLRFPGSLWNGNFGKFARMRDDGAAADLAPDSPLLRKIIPPFVRMVRDRHVHVILVAGADRYGMGMLANIYLWSFWLQCAQCHVPNDGVIPVASALGEGLHAQSIVPADARIFALRHADLKNDPAVIEYVASRLARPRAAR